MSDLEQVHDRKDAASDEHCLDRRLGVAGEEGGEPTVAQDHHHRAVVDVALGERRGRIGLGGIEDLDRRRGIEREDRAGSRERAGQDRLGGSIGEQAVMRRVLEPDPGVKERADLESVEGVDQPRDVVLVWVAEHHHADPSRVERQVRTNPTQRELRIGTAVDEHGRAGRRLDQDRVALADVEDGDVEPTVGPRRDGDGDEHDQEPSANGEGPQDASRDRREGPAGGS